MAKTQLWSLWEFPFPVFQVHMSFREEFPGKSPHQDFALAVERETFDPKSLVLAENCLPAQPEASQGKQRFVRGFHW